MLDISEFRSWMTMYGFYGRYGAVEFLHWNFQDNISPAVVPSFIKLHHWVLVFALGKFVFAAVSRQPLDELHR